MPLQFVDELELEGRRVLVRFDFNVPLDIRGAITDTTRIDASLPTIEHILAKGASKLIMMSHLGRPASSSDSTLGLAPVAAYLAEKIGQEVTLSESCTDIGIKSWLELPRSRLLLLENLRFHPEEAKGDREFAGKLANYAEVYINDAFGVCHRKHASVWAINAFFKNRAAGFLLKTEIEAARRIRENPASPFVAVIGGAKVSDKIDLLEGLLSHAQNILIGGAMAYPFLQAAGHPTGDSLCPAEEVSPAKRIAASKMGKKIVLPQDHIIAADQDGDARPCRERAIPQGMKGLDIGPATVQAFKEKLAGARTVFWNGPMGLFEREAFSQGTRALACMIGELKDAFSLVGGGDSAAAVRSCGLADNFSHVSTGGGASLAFLQKGSLPGIEALKFGVE